MRMQWSKYTIALLLILAAGLLVRGMYLLELSRSPRFEQPTSDEAFNDYWARAMATGTWSGEQHPTGPLFKDMPCVKAPGYPYFLAGLYRITAGSYTGVRIIQALMGVCSCWLLFLLGRSLFDQRTALLAAAMMSSYWVFVYYDSSLHAPTLVVFLVLLTLVLLDAWRDRFNWTRALCLGLLIGFLVLVRKNVLVFLPVLLFWMHRHTRRTGPRGFWPNAAILAAGIGITVAPITLRNFRASGQWVPISCDVGRNLYVGNNELADGIRPILPEQLQLMGTSGWSIFTYPDIIDGLEYYAGRGLTCVDTEKYFAKQAVKFALRRPGKVLRLTLKKAVLFWGPVEVSSDQVPPFDRLHSRVLRMLPGPFSFALTTALLGLVFIRREHHVARLNPSLVLLLGFIIVYFVSFLPGLPESRYRVALIPLLLLLGSHGMIQLARLLLRRETRRTGMYWLLGTAAAFVVINTNYTAYRPNEAKWFYETGIAYERAGKTRQAIYYFQEAVKKEPAFVEAYNNMGIGLANLGAFAKAERSFAAALQIDPANIRACQNLATMYLRSERADEALELAEKLLATRPNDYRVYNLIGLIAMRQANLEGALSYLRQASKLRPDDAEVINNMGAVLARLQRHDEAAVCFRTALELNPRSQDAMNNLKALETSAPVNPITPSR